MPLQKFIFRPGIDREGTDYSNEGGWFDANLVRFRKNLPEKIGGWAKKLKWPEWAKLPKINSVNIVSIFFTKLFSCFVLFNSLFSVENI